MKRPIYILLLLVILFLFSCHKEESKKNQPKAVKGVLDLRSVETFRETSLQAWDFEKDGTINLDGEWEFYFGEFCDPEPTRRIQACLNPTNTNYIPVPGNWNNFLVNEKPVGGDGYATYRLRVMLPKSNTPLALKIPDEGTAYVMYVNGEKFASNGSVGKEKDTSVPEHIPTISPLKNPKEELEILFHVSNFHYAIGGLWLPVKLGSEKQVRELRDRNLFLDMFLSGSILIMGFYHFFIYVLRRRDKSPLFFGAFCFFIVLRVLCTGEKFITSIFPETPFQLLIKMEYISFYLAGPCFAHFLYTIFPKEFKEKVLKSIWTIAILFSIPVVLTSTEIFTLTVNAFQIFTLGCIVYFLSIIGLAIFRKREGGKTLAAGFLIMAIGIVNDILVSRGIIYTGQIVPQCLFGFIFFQSIMLSMRFSKSFNQAEKLSNDLEQKSNRLEETSLELAILTQNLELKIQERTRDLEETKKEIEDLNTFSHLINSLSDLNSIFIEISKYFYHTFGIFGVWLLLPDEKREYLYAYKAYSYNKLPEDKYSYLMTKKIPLNENEGGIVYKNFLRKKPFYLSKILKFEFEVDREIVEKLSLVSFLQVPLVRKEECVGVFFFSNFEKEMKLSKSDIQKISNLCYQIAGTVDTIYLLQQVDKSRRETEALNEISKSVNSNLNIKGILDLAMGFVNKNFGIDLCALYLVDKQKNKIRITYLSNIIKDHLTLSDLEISKSEFSLEKIDHALGYVYQTKETLYTKELIESINEIEKKFIDIIKLKSSLFIPLLLKNEVIGILGFSNYDRIMDLKEFEITTLEKIADQLTGAIYNSNLLEETEKARAQSDLDRIEAEIERGISVIAKLEVEKAKKKTEDLNLLIKKVNEISDLEEIMKIILEYVKDNYHLPYYSLFTLDPNSNILKFANAIFPDYITPEQKKFFSSNSHSVEEKNMDSVHSRALVLKSPIFIADAEREVKTESGKKLIKLLNHKSFLTLPIFLQNNPIGTLDFFSLESLALREEEITELSLLAEQLAGVIQGATLFTQVQEEKEKALTAREESEKQKKETEELNLLIKTLNEDLDLKVILKKVLRYVNENYGIQYYALYTLTPEGTHVEISEANFPDFMTEEDRTKILNFKIPVQEVKGAHAFPFKAKRPFFIPRIKKTGATEQENFIGEKYKISSIFILPLILNNEIIGTIDFSSETKMELSKEDITKLSILGEQLAGIIHGSNLLKQVQEEKYKAEKAKQEIETLNEFTKLINSTSDILTIFKEIYSYLNKILGFNNLWVLLVDKNKKELYSDLNTTIYKEEDSLDSDFFKNFRVNLDEKLGTLYQTYTTAVPLYVADVSVGDIKTKTFINGFNGKTYLSSKTDVKIIIKGKLKSLLQIPLILQNEVIGILCLSIFDELLELSHEEIEKLVRFSNQIAGVIHNAQLLRQTEEAKVIANIEKEKALFAQKEMEWQKQETESLNNLIRSLNEDMNLEVIMKKIHGYIKNNYNINYYGLGAVNKDRESLTIIETEMPDYVSEVDRIKISQLKTQIKEKVGAHAIAFKGKKPFFFPRVRKTGLTPEETFTLEKIKFESLLIIPLILQNEAIGFLDLYNVGKMDLSKEDITKLSILGEQLAGIIHGSNLLKQVQEEKDKAEKAKQEIETLNEFTKLINSTSDISLIFKEIYSYLNRTFGVTHLWVLLVDKNKKELYSDTSTAVSTVEDSLDSAFFHNFHVNLDEKLGTLYQTYTTAVPLYIADATTVDIKAKTLINGFNGKTYLASKTDFKINMKGKLKSLLQIPLILQNEVIGIVCLSIFDKLFELSQDQIEKLVRFSNQIAGVIHNAQLLKQTEEAKGIANIEKENAIVAREDAEKTKAQIEFLNEFSKVINSYNNLDIIFSHAVENLSNKIDTDIFQLQLVDKTKNELFTRCLSGTDSGLMKKYNKLRVPLIPESGSLYLTYSTKKTLYLKNIKRNGENRKSELDKMVEKDFQTDSVFLIPLLVNDEVIGIMSIGKFGGMKKLKADEIRFVESLCEQLALAVNNSFLLEAAESERAKSEKLLLNILPKDVAKELKEKGFAEPVLFENVSVMFTDFKGFTTIAEKLSPQELIKDLDACFVQFDKISERFNLEKLKTIGDSYMCAGGIPKRNKTHAIDCCLAALEIQSFMNMMKELKEGMGFPYWELRLGIHTGPLIAGVIGERKFAYDVWGDTVNTASRMESSGTPGRINISYSTYEAVKDYFECEYRGEVSAKNKGVVKMYYLDRIKREFSKDEEGLMPNGKFWEMYG